MISFKEFLSEAGSPTYSLAEINTVGEWQMYGSSVTKLQAQIVSLSKKFPASVKKSSGTLYRFMFLTKTDYNKLLKGTELNHRHVEGWTTSLKQAKEIFQYARHYYTNSNNRILVFIKHQPQANEIVVNLTLLYKDKEWRKSLDHWNDVDIKNVSQGVEEEGSQNEVLLSKATFSKKDLVEAYDYNGKVYP